MATIFDVAKYILHEKGEMSTLKLQKLCYYAQAWSLAWMGEPLFSEDFEAWRDGPVCPQLFKLHKGQVTVSDIPKGNISNITEEEQETLESVLFGYGDYQAAELSEQTHKEAPWRNARAGIPDSAPCNNVISKISMRQYYRSLNKDKVFNREDLLKEIVRMADFASDALLVQLKDWFEERVNKEAEQYEPTVYSEEAIQSILADEKEIMEHPNPMSFEEFVAHCNEISARVNAEMAFEGAKAVNA